MEGNKFVDAKTLEEVEIQVVDEGKINRFNYQYWRMLMMPLQIRCIACYGLSELILASTCLSPDGTEEVTGVCQNCGREIHAEIYFFMS